MSVNIAFVTQYEKGIYVFLHRREFEIFYIYPLQCFDYDNYVDLNSRRPSSTCTHFVVNQSDSPPLKKPYHVMKLKEARALLGRLEYQRGNFEATLQVLYGIDIRSLSPQMIRAISNRNLQRNSKAKREKRAFNADLKNKTSIEKKKITSQIDWNSNALSTVNLLTCRINYKKVEHFCINW